MKKFNYTMNHKADEAYMKKMCHEGWAATSLVEGVWTFETCRPDQYTFRVCYLRGKSNEEVERLKRELAENGIEFVSLYSFWAIFRCEHDFELYTPEQELEICEKIYRPMPFGSIISLVIAALLLFLSVKVSAWFLILFAPFLVYGFICICLGISYAGLIRRLKRDRE